MGAFGVGNRGDMVNVPFVPALSENVLFEVLNE